jgi:hypothetical protein
MRSEPEPWQTSAPGAFLTIGDVSVWALGEQRFRVASPAGTEEIEGFAEAQRRAHELADRPPDTAPVSPTE